MKRGKRWLFIWGGVALLATIDQFAKWIARQTLAGKPIRSFGFDLLRLHYVENPGGFLSLGESLSPTLRFILFVVLTGVFILAAIVYVGRRQGLPMAVKVPWVLIIGGAVGNQIDRIVRDGRVSDFLNVGMGPVRTGIFNLADLFLTVGILWLLFTPLTKRDFPIEPQRD